MYMRVAFGSVKVMMISCYRYVLTLDALHCLQDAEFSR